VWENGVVDIFVRPNNNDEADGVRFEHAIDSPKGATASDGELQGAKAVERALEGMSCQGSLFQSAQRFPDLLTVLAKLLEILPGTVSQLYPEPVSKPADDLRGDEQVERSVSASGRG